MTLLVPIQRALMDAVEGLLDIEPEVKFPGVPYQPVAGRPWLDASVPARGRQPTGIGADSAHEWRGTLQLVVKHPDAAGEFEALRRAEAIASRLPRGKTLVSGPAKVVLWAVDIPPSYASADFISTPVVVSWAAWEIPDGALTP